MWTRRQVLVAAAACGAGACGMACAGSAAPPGPCAEPSSGNDAAYCLLEALVVRVFRAAGLVEGHAVLANVDDNTAVIVGRDAAGFYALSGICTHACCVVSLCGDAACAHPTSTPDACADTGPASGDAQGESILCPCHGSTFRLADGAALTGPATTALPSFALSFDGEDALVDTASRVAAGTRMQGSR